MPKNIDAEVFREAMAMDFVEGLKLRAVLRVWFTGQALAGLCSNGRLTDHSSQSLALAAISIADETIKQLAK